MKETLGFDTTMFNKKISEILDIDNFHFMKTATFQFQILREELRILSDKNINCRLNKMELYLKVYPYSNWELTRLLLKKDTRYLDELLHGHDQDWESANLL